MKYKQWRMIAIIFVVVGVLATYYHYRNKVIVEDSMNEAQIIFRFAETMPKGHPSAMAADYFAELVEERSNGHIKIKVYYDNKLGTTEEILEQLQFGGIAMAGVNALDLTETVTHLQKDFKLAMQGNAEEVLRWIENNSEPIEDSCQRERLFPLVWYYPDMRCFYSDDKKIQTISDFKEMKVVTTQHKIMKDTMQALQCEAVNIESADIHNSFITGYMDAGETTLSELLLSNYYSFIQYVTVSQYIVSPDVMLTNKEAFTALNKADRDLILQCAKDSCDYQKEQMVSFQNKILKKLKAEKEGYIEDRTFDEAISEVLEKEKGESND